MTTLQTSLTDTLAITPKSTAHSFYLNSNIELVGAFSPDGGGVQLVVEALSMAKVSILVQAYELTSQEIANAIVAAHARGCVIKVLMDKTMRTSASSKYKTLTTAGITCLFDDKVHIAHNKIFIIDSTYVITGSYNFSLSAEFSNAENILCINCPELATHYTDNWNTREKLCYTFADVAVANVNLPPSVEPPVVVNVINPNPPVNTVSTNVKVQVAVNGTSLSPATVPGPAHDLVHGNLVVEVNNPV